MWCDIDDAEYVREQLKVPGCQILMRVDREVFEPDGSLYSHDTRYFISSIDPGTVSPDDLLRSVRGHWQVENCLHWMKDRWWDEDKHYLKHCGEIFVTMTNAALSVLRLMQQPGENLRATADEVRYISQEVLRQFGFQTE